MTSTENRQRRLNTRITGISEDGNQSKETEGILKTIGKIYISEIKKK